MRHACVALISLGLAAHATAAAQTTADNLTKYDALRNRLRDELVSLGEEPGQGMPSHIRNDSAGYIRATRRTLATATSATCTWPW